MTNKVADLEPRALWNNFLGICAIPHGSGNEAGIRAHLLNWAKEHNFAAKADQVGNVVIYVPATHGLENKPVTILQGHMDMVCEKEPDKVFDFFKDGIEAIIDGDVVTASGTTLGADDGIGLAAAMAAATDSELAHGPLELLFTVEEETGLTGANGLDASLLKGTIMLNLDSEELGYITVGCAGGGAAEITLPLTFADSANGLSFFAVDLSGLKGGHSGIDIALQRGNAVMLLARALTALPKEMDLHLAAINGGDKHNALPRSATAVIGVKSSLAELNSALAAFVQKVDPELAKGHALKITATASEAQKLLDSATSAKVLNLIMAIPHGPLATSMEVPGLIQTSNNLAVVRTEASELVIKCSTRSAVDEELLTVLGQIKAIAALAGAKVITKVNYPGWKPDASSKVLATALTVSDELFGKPFEVAAIHAGLECGILGAKKPGLDKISFGPDLKSPHSPDEAVGIESVQKFYKFLKALIEKIAA